MNMRNDNTTFEEMDLLKADAMMLENEATDKHAKRDHHKLVNALVFAQDAGWVLHLIRTETSRFLEGKSPDDARTLMTSMVNLIDTVLKDRGDPED
jgi:hypothetical protein